MFLHAFLPSALLPLHNTFPVPKTCAFPYCAQFLWYCQMSAKDVRKKLLNPFLHLLKGRLWTLDSSSERLMHSLTAPSCSPFIYHFNLFAVSGKTEDTASQRIQGSKGLLEVIDNLAFWTKNNSFHSISRRWGSTAREKPTVFWSCSSAAVVQFRKSYPGLINEIIKVLEGQLISTQELGICSPVLAIYPKSRGAGRGCELPSGPLP